MKRTLSLILSLLMVLSLFAGLNIGAGARVSDLAETGAAYKLWLGSIQVTDTNKDDILRDGGKAKYDPATHILTLNDPDIPDVCVEEYALPGGTPNKRSFKIYTDGIPLTIKGSYHMTEPEQDYNIVTAYGVFVNNSEGKSAGLTLDGDFTIYGKGSGAALYIDDGDLNIKSGNVKFYGKGGITIGISLGGEGNINIDDNVESVTAEGGYAAIGYFNKLNIGESLAITDPGGAVIKKSETTNYNYVYEPNAKNISRYVVIEKKENVKYNLWLGETQVTCNNLSDILGDGGKAKYDPASHTLTLNDPVILGEYKGNKIYSYSLNLTVNGSYHMTGAESAYGIYFDDCDITVNGDFTVYGNASGIFSPYSDITLNGNVTSYGKNSGIEIMGNDLNINGGAAEFKSSGQSGYGIRLYGGALNISGSVESVTAEGTVAAVRAKEINITNTGNQDVRIIEPAGGMINHSDDEYNNYYIYEADGTTIAKRAVFSSHAPISSVTVTDVIAPMPGAFVDTSCSIPSGCGYKTLYNYYDGVTWYTEEGDILSHGVDKFVGGKKYTAQIALCALDGYVFSESATGTINGTNARVRVDNQRKTLYVNLTFTCPKAITAANCEVADPVVGEKPNYTAVSGDSTKYTAEVVNWFKGSGDRAVQMASRESFEAGNTYSVRVRYTAKDGYVFDENTVYTVNGQSTTYLGRGIYETSFTVINPNQPKPLASVSCTVTKPIAGQKPDNTAVPADSTKYSATVGSWIYGTGRTARTMSDDEEFIEGKSYQVQVKFTANRGYYLTDDTFCIINGKAATKVTIRGEDYYVVTFTAEAATTAVTEFSVTNIIEPVAGQSPYYYAAVPAGKGYQVEEDFTDGTWVNGVLWHNDTDHKDMTENDTFEAGKQYTVTVLLDSAAGYSFASNVSGTLNGENAEVISYGDRTIGVYRAFICQTTVFLGDVDFDGNIEIRDATWIQRSAADIEIPFVIKKLSADVDGDNNITVMDATAIQYYLANMKNPYNIGKKVSQ